MVHEPTEQERSLLAVVGWMRRFDLHEAFLGIVAGLHLIGAFTLAFAPEAQLFTQGTRPVFALFPPAVWSVAFIVGGALAVRVMLRPTPAAQAATWSIILPTQTIWLGASVLAVSHGGGSAMGVVFLTAVLAFTVVTALVIAVDWATGKR